MIDVHVVLKLAVDLPIITAWTDGPVHVGDLIATPITFKEEARLRARADPLTMH